MTPGEYYANHYPYEQLVKLLTRNGDDLANCEFAIEGKTASGDKLYKRYVSVRGPSELRDVVSRFTGVTAFHFGAFYSNGSSREAVKSGESVPVRRVLSFDIDLTDLEFLSLKDAKGNVSAEKCDAAYPVSAAAAYIVRTVMRKAFGFSEILIVYSGRRGVHVHVFDDKAMGLNDEERSAILDYVNCGMAKTELHAPTGVRLIMDLHGLHDLVYNTFHTYIVGRLGIFEKASARLALLDRLNLASYEEYETFAPTLAPLATDVLRCETGAEAWKHVEQRIRSTNVEWMRERLDCVVLAYVWPRLDEAVSRSLGHLTKVPFSCHATTGRVAVAMEAKQKSIYKFSPARQAPSLKEWDQTVMDAAVTRFRVGDALVSSGTTITGGGVDMEDMAGAQPHRKGFKRKQSPLATCVPMESSASASVNAPMVRGA